MSQEQAPKTPEAKQSQERLDDAVSNEALKASIERRAANAERNNTDNKIEQARSTIERQAAKSEQPMTSSEQSHSGLRFEPHDRKKTYKQTMSEVRSKLSSSAQQFSKVIHQPAVDAVSDVASKTVGRSSLLLGGFMATFIGTLVIFANARSNGYGVSNLTFLVVLFVLGAASGLVIEIVYRALKRYRQG